MGKAVKPFLRLRAKRHEDRLTYHKPVGVPAKADGAKQAAWIAWYEKLKKSLQDKEKILFMDGVHPTHAVRFACGWIKKGVRKEIPTNGSQKRMNILGALDLEDMAVHKQEYLTIDAVPLRPSETRLRQSVRNSSHRRAAVPP